jgi:uncharacterized protein (TIGR00730 family)
MAKTSNKNVCVFLSAGDVLPVYEKATLEFIRLLIKNNYNFVYGGSERGLMKKAADEVKKMGGKIISVASEEFREVWRKEVDEMIICPNIPDRKKKILEVSDAIVVLPGGTGTLDEFTEILETKKWGNHDKPIVLLNTDNFWQGLLQQFDKMNKEKFILKPIDKLFYVADIPYKAINFLNKKIKFL